MTILVTGSAGHLGEALMQTLRAESRWVRGIDIKPSAFTDMVGSISDRAFVRQAMSGISHVIHAATLHKPHVATHGNYDSSTPISPALCTCSKRRPPQASQASSSPAPPAPSVRH